MSNRTACGRPARDTYSIFATSDGQYGDKNYGYITPCQITSSGTCSSGYSAVPNTWCGPLPPGGNQVFSPACSVMANACVPPNPIDPAINYVCQSNWNSPTYSANMVNCCAGLSSSSDVCAPETCAASDPSSNTGTGASGCHAAMMQFCTPANWINNAVGWQGLTVQGEVACDTYVKTANSTVKVDGTNNSSQAIIRNAIQQYYAPGSGNNPKTPTDAFAQKAVVLARQYPGLVDDILTGVCSQYKRGDLTVQPTTQYDPNGTNLIQTCGCFLPATEYYIDPETNVACDTLCAYPGAIPKGNGQGGALQCGGTTCVINNVAVDLLNSNGGSIDFSQVCGNCSPGSGPCRCLFGDNSVSVIGNSSIAGVQVADKCGECFNMVQNPDGTFTLNKVDCGSIQPPSGGGGGGDIFNDAWTWIKGHAIISVIIAVIVLFFIIGLIFLIVYAEKKKGR